MDLAVFSSAFSVTTVSLSLLWGASVLSLCYWAGEFAAYRQTVAERYAATNFVNTLRKAKTPARLLWATFTLFSLALFPMPGLAALLVGILVVSAGVFVDGPLTSTESLKDWAVLGVAVGMAGMHHPDISQGRPALELGLLGAVAGLVGAAALLHARHANEMRKFTLYKQD
jgi:hypothetical protein